LKLENCQGRLQLIVEKCQGHLQSIKLMFFLALSFFIYCGMASADSFRGGHIACVSEKLYDDIISAAAREDEKGVRYFMKNGCVITKEGIDISVLDVSWTGKAKVRAYIGDKVFVVWTSVKNIDRSK